MRPVGTLGRICNPPVLSISIYNAVNRIYARADLQSARIE